MGNRKHDRHRRGRSDSPVDVALRPGGSAAGLNRQERRRPILRFVLWFILLALAFNIFYYAYFSRTIAFEEFLAVNAGASAAVMRLFGADVSANGANLSGPRFAMTIAIGCDAIQPASLFFFAVLASPVAWRTKVPGLLVGTPLLLLLNIVRIMSLYYCGVHRPSWFDVMHMDIWQAGYIVIALLFWILWALWAKRATADPSRATA